MKIDEIIEARLKEIKTQLASCLIRGDCPACENRESHELGKEEIRKALGLVTVLLLNDLPKLRREDGH